MNNTGILIRQTYILDMECLSNTIVRCSFTFIGGGGINNINIHSGVGGATTISWGGGIGYHFVVAAVGMVSMAYTKVRQIELRFVCVFSEFRDD